jgi:hypothetical protein
MKRSKRRSKQKEEHLPEAEQPQAERQWVTSATYFLSMGSKTTNSTTRKKKRKKTERICFRNSKVGELPRQIFSLEKNHTEI